MYTQWDCTERFLPTLSITCISNWDCIERFLPTLSITCISNWDCTERFLPTLSITCISNWDCIKRFLPTVGMTAFPFFREGCKMKAASPPSSYTPFYSLINVIPNGAKRNEESVLLHLYHIIHFFRD